MNKIEETLATYLPIVVVIFVILLIGPSVMKISQIFGKAGNINHLIEISKREYQSALQTCLKYGGTAIKYYERPSGLWVEKYYYCLDSRGVAIGKVMPTGEPYEYVFVPIRG